MRQIRYAVNSEPGCRVWRNNVGYDSEHAVKYGLAVGSADLIGIAHSKFLALEVKTPTGRASADQVLWLAAVARLGGIAVIVRSVDEALAVVRGLR